MIETFEINLTFDELNAILAGLAELPFKVAQPVIQKLVDQYKEQTEKTD